MEPMWYDTLLEKRIVPDFIIRQQIRSLLKARLKEQQQAADQSLEQTIRSFVAELSESPIAVNTQDANEQHYELPTEFFEYALGPHMKYSCGFWENGETNLKDSEYSMLKLTCSRAELKPNQEVLELGCGWGSLSLFMSKQFPSSNFTVVSNSRTQKKYIDEQAEMRGIHNLTVITSDINAFSIDKKFDRVVSVEMFEHMRNYKLLMKRIAGWLKDDGKLFVHIFTHHKYAYKFEVKDESDWMSKYFFTGGIMPSNDLLFYFDEDLVKQDQWLVNGKNYQKTSEAWLTNMDAYEAEVIPIMNATYGEKKGMLWLAYWRIFFMSCAELWGYRGGNEWMISHYLFKKRK
ncbi:MAG: class I SAM-dependent methyltransferase [Chryseolinea sp.]